MKNDTKSRKWLVTINNPAEKGYTHERIKEVLSEFESMVYWCMSDEIGEEETYHTHIYIHLRSATRFSTIKKRFDGGHFDVANGTAQQNRDYVFKQGEKWGNDKKQGTNLPETHEEEGELPEEEQGKRNDVIALYSLIKEGASNFEIIDTNPRYMDRLEKIERVRQILKYEQFKNTFRQLYVEYVFGETESGKTRGVMEQYGYENVYRVTNYLHPFDNYAGEDIIAFEEFRSSLKIQDMLNYLDGYPLHLPCRYNNKMACYTKVYLMTNIPLTEQYKSVQFEHVETWRAFLRRIHKIREYRNGGVVEYSSLKEYEEEKELREVEKIFAKREVVLFND